MGKKDSLKMRIKTQNQVVRLEKWTEVIGNFIKIEHDDYSTSVFLRVLNKPVKQFIVYGKRESIILKSSLKRLEKGTKIAILRTDLQLKPIIVKIFEVKK